MFHLSSLSPSSKYFFFADYKIPSVLNVLGENDRKEVSYPMTKKDKATLAEGLKRICADLAVLASLFEDDEVPEKQDAPAEEKSEAPAKVYTYEEVRAILAEKSRTGFRAEVKAILTRHGVTQLSDVKDPKTLAAIVAEAEEIQVG